MRRELKKIQAENSALAQKVQGGRESISQTEHRISAAVDEWKVRERESTFILMITYSLFFSCYMYIDLFSHILTFVCIYILGPFLRFICYIIIKSESMH